VSLWRRRTVLASTLALAACGKAAKSEPQTAPLRPLKAIAPFPIGCSVMTGQLNDPAYVSLLTTECSQITPEWEMKMEYILQEDGRFKFDAPDAIAAFASAHGMRLHGHNLIWYAQAPDAFKRVTGEAFANAFRNYILAVAGRYRGLARGWDVVNEPVTDDGAGLRSCLWSQRLGQLDYMVRAFDHAREADDQAVLFVNDYNLESNPAKRATFLRMIDDLLKRGCKISGLGTQTHIDIDLPAGAVAACIKDLARFGLPIHVSELDISTHPKKMDLRSDAERLRLQARQAGAGADAFAGLPAGQRYAFSLWGLRDQDSWLRGPQGSSPDDQPALFDSAGRAKADLAAVAQAFGRLH
jgi:endo-1,4-beta-xylanase